MYYYLYSVAVAVVMLHFGCDMQHSSKHVADQSLAHAGNGSNALAVLCDQQATESAQKEAVNVLIGSGVVDSLGLALQQCDLRPDIAMKIVSGIGEIGDHEGVKYLEAYKKRVYEDAWLNDTFPPKELITSIEIVQGELESLRK